MTTGTVGLHPFLLPYWDKRSFQSLLAAPSSQTAATCAPSLAPTAAATAEHAPDAAVAAADTARTADVAAAAAVYPVAADVVVRLLVSDCSLESVPQTTLPWVSACLALLLLPPVASAPALLACDVTQLLQELRRLVETLRPLDGHELPSAHQSRPESPE